jgi:hypothetical protein
LTFRADSKNGKEGRNLKSSMKGKSIFLLWSHVGKLFPQLNTLKKISPFTEINNFEKICHS